MIKMTGPILVACLMITYPMINCIASGPLPPSPSNDLSQCGSLITKGDSNPPQAADIAMVQSCLANCPQLYADLEDPQTALSGISYCRSNLGTVYYQSINQATEQNLKQNDIQSVKDLFKKINRSGLVPQSSTVSASTITISPPPAPAIPSTAPPPPPPSTPYTSPVVNQNTEMNKPPPQTEINWY